LAQGGETPDEGMIVKKSATDNEDGTYTIELEAYATGESIISDITQDVQTDIVLVLDQSGSMDYDFTTTVFNSYGTRTNSYFYSRRHNGGENNLWYELEDGSYASVSVVREPFTVYSAISGWSNFTYYFNNTNLYQLVDDVYYKVTVTRTGGPLSRVYTYTSDGGLNFTSSGTWNSPENFGGLGPLYRRTGTDYDYTYSYTDSGNTVTIGASTGTNTNFTDVTLYERTTETITRLQALKNALTTFASQINAKAAGADGVLGTEDDVNHRVAVVGFASGDYYNGSYHNYRNTEIFIGATQYGYGLPAQGVYGTAFQNMDTAGGQANVTDSINALDANGGTLTNLGVEMANGILNANPVPEGETRNRIVVVFTDGVPGWSGYDSTIANAAIAEADTTKYTRGATVYTIGIFDGADATSPGNPNGNETQKANWFMQKLSSNNGVVQDPSYYLSAADAETLTNIFEQIADQIEEGGTTVTLGSESIIKDIVGPSFTLPEGTTAASITLETYKYNGSGYEVPGAWTKNADAMGATAAVDSATGTVSVTGFDFSENWAGSVTEGGSVSYRGHKLVIKFNVVPRPGFLGGNGVPTNTSAGVYKDDEATNPVVTFGPSPEMDVPIPDINITTPSAAMNVYLLYDIPATDLHAGVTVQIGTVSLNLNPDAVNWGLQPWQNEYVNISVVYKDSEGNPIPQEGLKNLVSDTSYSVTVTVSPKTAGSVPGAGETHTGNLTVNVFKPELTFNDIFVFYGDDAPTDTEYASAWDDTKWKHGDVLSTSVTMIGTAPQLVLTYTPEADKIEDGEVNTKQDIKVDVSVKIDTTDVTDHTTFLHTACVPPPPCSWDETTPDGSPAFLLHVNTCTLTIQKTGGAADESYVFNIYKDDTKYSEVTIWGNEESKKLWELPVGAYTIKEDTDWSWRYTANNGSAVNLTADSPNGSITCQNTKAKDHWLNGYSLVVDNVYNDN
jgi:hypothetical protein